eukprot:TRINITY_DN12717_c0_g1_i1.p1 TRINITY_DN12717_c0_g1~~TRINITY_DN12717_c0_g1_i1.p1  ORF type:complete len:431 (-),score=69.25 TRINITY_DN12717_c0_g1_i1:107-1351(-)
MASFVRKGKGRQASVAVPGSRKSVQNGLTLVSCGLHEVDSLIGGGLPLGSLFLVEQDLSSSYYELMLRYFLVEGVAKKHSIYVASAESDPEKFVQNLPALSVAGSSSRNSSSFTPSSSSSKKTAQSSLSSSPPLSPPSPLSTPSAPKMKIAWQYEKYLHDDQSLIGRIGTQTASFADKFDLSKKVNPGSLGLIKTYTFDPATVEVPSGVDPFQFRLSSLYTHISDAINAVNSKFSSPSCNVLRICIQSLGSPFWGSSSSPRSRTVALIRFLHALRGVVRESAAVVALSVDPSLFEESTLAQMRHLCDVCVRLESFVEKALVPPDFADFHGFFYINKVSVVNSLMPAMLPHGRDHTFVLKRKKLHIAGIELQPELKLGGPASEKEKAETKLKQTLSPEGNLSRTPGSIPEALIDF